MPSNAVLFSKATLPQKNLPASPNLHTSKPCSMPQMGMHLLSGLLYAEVLLNTSWWSILTGKAVVVVTLQWEVVVIAVAKWPM